MWFEEVCSKVIVPNFQEVKLSLSHRKNSKSSNLGVSLYPRCHR